MDDLFDNLQLKCINGLFHFLLQAFISVMKKTATFVSNWIWRMFYFLNVDSHMNCDDDAGKIDRRIVIMLLC
jgi:hypothetical protein